MRQELMTVLLAGCGGVEHAYLALPEVGAARTLILAVEEPNQRGLRLIAADRAESLQVPVSDGVTLHLFAYERSLEELGLASGPVDEPSLSRRDCARLEPEVVFVASGAPEQLEWIGAEMPALVQERLVDSPQVTCGPCRTFELEDVLLPGTGWPMFAVSAGADVLVGLDRGALIRIGAEGELTGLCQLPAGVRSGAWRESDRSLVIGLDGGNIFRALDLSGPNCAVEQLGAVEGMATRMALSESGPLVAYVLSDREGEAQLWRVELGSSQKLHQHLVDPELVPSDERGYSGGVAWLEPEHVLFVAGDDAIYRLRGGAVTVERLERDELEYRVQSLALTAFGPIVAVEPLGIAVHQQGRWNLAAGDRTWRQPTALLPYEDLVLIGQLETLEAFRPEDLAYCPSDLELGQEAPQVMARLGASDVIVADRVPPPRVRCPSCCG